MTLPVAILAGGLATRLRPITETIPKALVDVEGKPFVVHQLELLRRHNVERVVLCVGYLGDQVEATLGNGRSLGIDLAYSYDGADLLGTGGALRRALPKLGQRFLVLYGDSYLQCDYADIARDFVQSEKLGLMTVYRNEGRWDRSNVLFRGGRIVRYNKHQGGPEMSHIDYGLGALRAQALEGYPARGVLDLATVYQDLLSRGELAALEVEQRFYEIGSPAGLQQFRQLVHDLGRP
jgi:N-acetyl-alpha-D-muramate 1-phosphate uridylyltransferase